MAMYSPVQQKKQGSHRGMQEKQCTDKRLSIMIRKMLLPPASTEFKLKVEKKQKQMCICAIITLIHSQT